MGEEVEKTTRVVVVNGRVLRLGVKATFVEGDGEVAGDMVEAESVLYTVTTVVEPLPMIVDVATASAMVAVSVSVLWSPEVGPDTAAVSEVSADDEGDWDWAGPDTVTVDKSTVGMTVVTVPDARVMVVVRFPAPVIIGDEKREVASLRDVTEITRVEVSGDIELRDEVVSSSEVGRESEDELETRVGTALVTVVVVAATVTAVVVLVVKTSEDAGLTAEELLVVVSADPVLEVVGTRVVCVTVRTAPSEPEVVTVTNDVKTSAEVD